MEEIETTIQKMNDEYGLLTESNVSNKEILDWKQELSAKLGLGDEASIEWNLKYDVRL